MNAPRLTLAIDLGTTSTAAAVADERGVRMVELGSTGATIPSVAAIGADGELVAGEPAARRRAVQPDQVAAEFKRRFGDPTPINLGSTPYGAEALSAALLAAVLHKVRDQEGEPDLTIITYPAGWGPYKLELLQEAAGRAGCGNVELLAEPIAAGLYYADSQSLEKGDLVAVYDLGGGTFDATVLRWSGSSLEVLGRPGGLDRLGGIDFDHAVLGLVDRALDGAISDLDLTDSDDATALTELSDACTSAKEALSAESAVDVPVALPSGRRLVRVTRAELEAAMAGRLGETHDAFVRTLDSAGVDADDLQVVLLVGGASRAPVVRQALASVLGVHPTTYRHPKHIVAMGAALAPRLGEPHAAEQSAAIGKAAGADRSTGRRPRWLLPVGGLVVVVALALGLWLGTRSNDAAGADVAAVAETSGTAAPTPPEVTTSTEAPTTRAAETADTPAPASQPIETARTPEARATESSEPIVEPQVALTSDQLNSFHLDRSWPDDWFESGLDPVVGPEGPSPALIAIGQAPCLPDLAGLEAPIAASDRLLYANPDGDHVMQVVVEFASLEESHEAENVVALGLARPEFASCLRDQAAELFADDNVTFRSTPESVEPDLAAVMVGAAIAGYEIESESADTLHIISITQAFTNDEGRSLVRWIELLAWTTPPDPNVQLALADAAR